MYDYLLYFIHLIARNISILTFYNEGRRQATRGVEHKAIQYYLCLFYNKELDRELATEVIFRALRNK
jgi:hypothetical protein